MELDFIRDLKGKYGKLGEEEKKKTLVKPPVSRKKQIRGQLQEVVDKDTADELARARELA